MIKPQIISLGASPGFRDIAEHFSGRPHFIFLDSGIQGDINGKYSYIAFDPFLVFKSKGNKVAIYGRNGQVEHTTGNPFDVLNGLLAKYKIDPSFGKETSNFLGGAIGYFAYEMGRQIEKLPERKKGEPLVPECYVCFYDTVFIYDGGKNKISLSHCAFEESAPLAPALQRLLDEVAAIPAGIYESSMQHSTENNGPAAGGVTSDFTQDEYMRAINRVKEYILAGDVYQVNLTQRFKFSVGSKGGWGIYKMLMRVNPAPFACYLNFEDVCIASSSPERFFKVVDGEVETRPIKGTIRRGADPSEDARNMETLKNCQKNRAELAMIVDLLRNDLGRVCKPGTVKVKAFPELETYASVHHLVATITGELLEGKSPVDLLQAAFPGGSITGAPKIRAMEIIDELEPVARGVYTGSIGYLGFNGNADLNIVIRTIIITGQMGHIQAGGGIVADSTAEDEYHESILKAKNLFKALARG